jgi:hypothetical protein
MSRDFRLGVAAYVVPSFVVPSFVVPSFVVPSFVVPIYLALETGFTLLQFVVVGPLIALAHRS